MSVAGCVAPQGDDGDQDHQSAAGSPTLEIDVRVLDASISGFLHAVFKVNNTGNATGYLAPINRSVYFEPWDLTDDKSPDTLTPGSGAGATGEVWSDSDLHEIPPGETGSFIHKSVHQYEFEPGHEYQISLWYGFDPSQHNVTVNVHEEFHQTVTWLAPHDGHASTPSRAGGEI